MPARFQNGKPRHLLLTLLGIAAGISCDLPTEPSDGVGCTTHLQPGIEVEIRAKADGQPLAYWAQGVVREDTYSDSLEPYRFLNSDPQSMVARQAARERPGTYSVEVTVPGFQPIQIQNVTVVAGRCHVQTATVQALLQPM